MKIRLKNITLQEKINQENKEINDIIGKALRSKTVARKYEDKFKELGISVDYSQPQGVTLIGPNGKRLEASKDYIGGPAKPNRYGTHDQGWPTYKRYLKRDEEELDSLKAMKRDDIIRKYSNLSSKDALKKHKEDIARAEKNYAQDKENYEGERKQAKENRREGHLRDPETRSWKKEFGKPFADTHVDYLNYLTKKGYGDDFRNDRSYSVPIQKTDDDYTWFDKDKTKNPVINKKSDTINKYNELKNRISNAKSDVNWHTYDDKDNFNSSYAAMTDEQLESKIQKMRDQLEKDIEALRKANDKNKESRAADIKELEVREKELDDFLKAKGVRESAKYYEKVNLRRLETVLKESSK